MKLLDLVVKKTNTYAKKASVTYEEILFFYQAGIQSSDAKDGGDKKAIEEEVFKRIYLLFPERREKNLKWDVLNQALADHIPLEKRNEILGKIFNP